MNLELIKQNGFDYIQTKDPQGVPIENLFKFRDLDSENDKGNLKTYKTHRIGLSGDDFNDVPTQIDVDRAKELITDALNAMETTDTTNEPDSSTVITEGGNL